MKLIWQCVNMNRYHTHLLARCARALELRKLKYSWCTIAREFGVTAATARKYAGMATPVLFVTHNPKVSQ